MSGRLITIEPHSIIPRMSERNQENRECFQYQHLLMFPSTFYLLIVIHYIDYISDAEPLANVPQMTAQQISGNVKFYFEKLIVLMKITTKLLREYQFTRGHM
jgi:hypothetical protein